MRATKSVPDRIFVEAWERDYKSTHVLQEFECTTCSTVCSGIFPASLCKPLTCVCACVRACMRACVCACVHACVRACVREYRIHVLCARLSHALPVCGLFTDSSSKTMYIPVTVLYWVYKCEGASSPETRVLVNLV